jgi:L-fuconolactonase
LNNLPPVIQGARTVRPDLAEDYSPARVVSAAQASGFSGVVFVHARDAHEDSLGEANFFIDAATEHPEVVGAVVGVDLLDPKGTAAMLDTLRGSKILRGVRMITPENSGVGILSDARAKEVVALLGERQLSLDLLIRCSNEGQLHEGVQLVQWAAQHTKTTIIGDHLLKPTGISEGKVAASWKDALKELAACGNFFMKLSGLPGEVAPGSDPSIFCPFFDAALEALGPSRLMFGSDHPVSYGHAGAVNAVVGWLKSRGLAAGVAAQQIFSDTSITAYRL